MFIFMKSFRIKIGTRIETVEEGMHLYTCRTKGFQTAYNDMVFAKPMENPQIQIVHMSFIQPEDLEKLTACMKEVKYLYSGATQSLMEYKPDYGKLRAVFGIKQNEYPIELHSYTLTAGGDGKPELKSETMRARLEGDCYEVLTEHTLSNGRIKTEEEEIFRNSTEKITVTGMDGEREIRLSLITAEKDRMAVYGEMRKTLMDEMKYLEATYRKSIRCMEKMDIFIKDLEGREDEMER